MESRLVEQFNLMLNCIREIPTFDGGEQSQLPDFLAQVEAILPSVAEFEETNRNILFGYIKNKCVGETRETIHRHGVVRTWETLREILVTDFGEKETTRELMDKLKTWRLDSTIEKYHYGINKIRNRLHNRRLTHSEEGLSADEINRISLEVFKDNLPEPTKTIIFARNPQTLEAAFRIILEARHQNYTAPRNGQKNDNIRSSYRTNFSNDVRRTNSGNRNFDSRNNGNQNQGNSHDNGQWNQNRNRNNNGSYNYNNNNRNNRDNNENYTNSNQNNNFNRNNQEQNYQNSGNSRRQSNQSRNPNNLNRYNEEPMDVGNYNVNFRGDDPNNFPM